MKIAMAIIAGACYSASYVAPMPWCIDFLLVSTILVIWMRAG